MNKLEVSSMYGETPKKEQLSLNKYQYLADVTRNKDITYNESLTNYALGLTGEAGEVADLIKKSVFHGHNVPMDELIKELGDVLWYIASLASTIDVSLEDIANKNTDKLKTRYPEGFDQNKSINRVE